MALAAGLSLSSCCLAAGGHHAVDDAALLEPGQCNVEAWAARSNVDRRRLQHVGSACRVLDVELGLNVDRATTAVDPTARLLGVQLKWATELQPTLALGAVVAVNRHDHAPRMQRIVLVPLTWTPREDLAVHLNVGRDVHGSGPHHTPRGIAVEWQPTAAWQGLAEYFHDGQRPLRRLGLRRFFGPNVTLDLSYARTGSTAETAKEDWWTLGLSWAFER
ncbi:hypothetical protein CDN99_13435 [Roseateles aquatilis]|uniref:Uncharacterized protein n=1 Tax=Roseateles aquatilis TaxID=431061 RepID=A0A246JCM4_9BURK|nr:hypothetical protein CDN99_13435 [Roseateles aquatilis]